jgi:hypothetical protein
MFWMFWLAFTVLVLVIETSFDRMRAEQAERDRLREDRERNESLSRELEELRRRCAAERRSRDFFPLGWNGDGDATQ